MGKEHWAKHAAKPAPIRDYPIAEGIRIVVRERRAYYPSQRFVATVRYDTPPQKGAYVITYAYGPTADAAETRALDAYYSKAQTG